MKLECFNQIMDMQQFSHLACNFIKFQIVFLSFFVILCYVCLFAVVVDEVVAGEGIITNHIEKGMIQ